MRHYIPANLILFSILSSVYGKFAERRLAFGIPAPMRLKILLESEMDGTRESQKPILLPCCYDGLSARLVARAGFDATFMTGFGVSGEQRVVRNIVL
jgi:hypothetical protein